MCPRGSLWALPGVTRAPLDLRKGTSKDGLR